MSIPLSNGAAPNYSISMIAHELRAPLSSVATATELLTDDLARLRPEQVRDMLMVIRQGTFWLQGLVENLLCAATMEAGGFRIRREPIDVLDIITDVQPLVAPLLIQKSQRLKVAAHAALPKLWGDRRWLGHSLMNLIANASKYSPFGQAILARLTVSDHVVRVTVADRGAGLATGSEHRLFEPFYRAVGAEDLDRSGFGLGLAIVKSIVTAHGGRVGAHNRARGGACVWFELPLTTGTGTPAS